jgi:hypothetical protein
MCAKLASLAPGVLANLSKSKRQANECVLWCPSMWRRLAFVLSMFLSFLLLTPIAQAQTVPLSATSQRVDLGGKLDWLKDEVGQLNISDVAVSSAFKPLAGELNVGFTPAAIWLRVEVARTHLAPNHWLLEITNPCMTTCACTHKLPTAVLPSAALATT